MKIQNPKSKIPNIFRMRSLREVIRNQSGQGLLEAVIALGIIVTGIVGTMNLTISNQTSSADAQERLIAINLAREGVEIVRNIRDTNWLSCEILNCNDWDQGLESGSDVIGVPIFNPSANAWTIDFTADDITHNSARIWRKSSGNPQYIGTLFQSTEQTPADSALTEYKRILEIYSICSDKAPAETCAAGDKIGMRAQSRVAWESRGKSFEVIAEERLFNWR